MGYREVGLMRVVEELRRWQAQESIRAIAQATGLARNSVRKYLRGAAELGLTAQWPPATNAQMRHLAQLGETSSTIRVTPLQAMLEPHREQIGCWARDDGLQITRVAELLAREGVAGPLTTLRRFVRHAGLDAGPRDAVLRAPSAPGELAEPDFGRLGPLVDPVSGKHQIIWALSVVLPSSCHSFVWPMARQTLEAVIEGLEAA